MTLLAPASTALSASGRPEPRPPSANQTPGKPPAQDFCQVIEQARASSEVPPAAKLVAGDKDDRASTRAPRAGLVEGSLISRADLPRATGRLRRCVDDCERSEQQSSNPAIAPEELEIRPIELAALLAAGTPGPPPAWPLGAHVPVENCSPLPVEPKGGFLVTAEVGPPPPAAASFDSSDETSSDAVEPGSASVTPVALPIPEAEHAATRQNLPSTFASGTGVLENAGFAGPELHTNQSPDQAGEESSISSSEAIDSEQTTGTGEDAPIAGSAALTRHSEENDSAPPSADSTCGTAVASVQTRMNALLKSPGFSKPDEQNLPSEAEDHLPGVFEINDASEELASVAQRSLTPVPDSILGGFDGALPANACSLIVPELETMPETQPDPATASAVRNLEEAIFSHVVQVRELNAKGMAVLLKVDSETEVFLRLSHREGHVEAIARCERGDFGAMQSEWGSLQARLAEHGIRLAPLTGEPPAQQAAARSPEAQPQSQQNNTNAERHPHRPARNPLDELPMVGSLTEPLKRRAGRGHAGSRRGWEVWA